MNAKYYEIAPQEQLRFVEKLLDVFLDRVLDHPEAIVTDLTVIRHFTSYDIEDSIGKGTKPGHYLFKQRVWRKVNPDGSINLHKPKSVDDYKEEIIEVKAIHERKWIIRKCRRVFGVDISDVYDKNIPEVMLYIMKHIRKEMLESIFPLKY
jgi:hypothetical protein